MRVDGYELDSVFFWVGLDARRTQVFVQIAIACTWLSYTRFVRSSKQT